MLRQPPLVRQRPKVVVTHWAVHVSLCAYVLCVCACDVTRI